MLEIIMYGTLAMGAFLTTYIHSCLLYHEYRTERSSFEGVPVPDVVSMSATRPNETGLRTNIVMGQLLSLSVTKIWHSQNSDYS